MAPPGRRRHRSLFSLTLLLTFLFASTASAASAVLGIDLGTEFIKAALVKPGVPLDIVLTKDSKRKETAAVAFKPVRDGKPDVFPERLYGSDAVVLAARFPADVYPNLKSLLGLTVEGNGIVEDYGSRHPALDIRAAESKGTAAIKSAAFEETEEPFLVEELLAMQLVNVKGNAEAMAGMGEITDAVITIPAFYTAEERRAVELAATLAGFRVLGLVSDGLAVGINYATSRQFLSPAEGGRPEYHLVFDMGAGSTTATVLKFQGKVVKDVGRFNKTIQDVSVIGVGWDRTLGGDALNGVVMDDIIQAFAESPTVKKMEVGEKAAEAVRTNGRSAARLWKEAQRVRQVLSANSDTVASFEGLYEEIDFRYKVSRAKFEELTTSFAERVSGPVNDALKAAKLDFVDLDSVILHGGAARTPFVQKKLEKLIGGSGKLRTNVNADEAAVFGAAFQGAGLSASFRVKEIRTSDIAGYAAGISWNLDGKERQQKLFLPTSLVGAEKTNLFKTQADFSFDFYQQLPGGPSSEDSIDVPVSTIETRNLTASVAKLAEKGCTKDEIHTKFTIRLSPNNGLQEVAYGSVSCEVDPGAEKKGGVVDDVKGFFGFGGKKSEQEPITEGEEAKSRVEEDVDTESMAKSSETTAETSTTTTSSIEAKKSKAPKKKKLEIVYIDFGVNPKGLPQMSPEQLSQIKQRLASFDASDMSRRLREETLNTLEGLTYRYRDLLSDLSFEEASTKDERTTLEEHLSFTGDWLYGEGADADKDTLKEKLDGLKNIVEPIEFRREEAVKRPQQVKLLEDALEQTKKLIDVVRDQAVKAAEAAEAAAAEAVAAVTETSTSTEDESAELEDPTSTTTVTATEKPSKAPEAPPVFSLEDVTAVSSKYESVKEWLEEKIKLQLDLFPHDIPILTSIDIQEKAKELNQMAMDLVKRKSRPPKPSKSKTSKSKTKTKKSKTKSATAEAESDSFKDWKPDAPKGGGFGDVPIIDLKMGMSMEEMQEAIKEAEATQGKSSSHDEL